MGVLVFSQFAELVVVVPGPEGYPDELEVLGHTESDPIYVILHTHAFRSRPISTLWRRSYSMLELKL